jgi:hypothetical protein
MFRKDGETWGIPANDPGLVRAAPAASEASRKVLRVGMILISDGLERIRKGIGKISDERHVGRGLSGRAALDVSLSNSRFLGAGMTN